VPYIEKVSLAHLQPEYPFRSRGFLGSETAGERIDPRAKVVINVGDDHAFDARPSRLKSRRAVEGASPPPATSRASGICVTQNQAVP
jgi:hypothetical protein